MTHKMTKKFAIATCLTLLGSCNEKAAEEQAESLAVFNRIGLLQSISTNVMTPRLTDFSTSATSLHSTFETQCSALSGTILGSSQLQNMKTAWVSTMKIWQEIEAFQLGPISENSFAKRYDIYSWPNLSPCAVDTQVSALVTATNASYTLPDNAYYPRGLGAIEYLLYDTDLDHGCSATTTETQNWNARSANDRSTYRCQYLVKVADDLKTKAAELLTAWGDESSGYAETFLAAGTDVELQTRLSSVSEGLFYLDLKTKDRKLAIPLGISSKCYSFPCLTDIEHRSSALSLGAVESNIKGFAAIYRGYSESSGKSEGVGFDDYLTDTDYATEKSNMDAAVTAALEKAASLSSESLETKIGALSGKCASADDSDVCSMYYKVKDITDLLKGEFSKVLKLDIPSTAASDND